MFKIASCSAHQVRARNRSWVEGSSWFEHTRMQIRVRSRQFDLRGSALRARSWAACGFVLLSAACSTARESRTEDRASAPSDAPSETSSATPSERPASNLDLPTEIETAPVALPTPAEAVEVVAPEPAPAPPVEAPPVDGDTPTPEAADKPDELRTLLEHYYADFGGRDWKRFETHFWPGATIVAIRQPPGGGPERVVSTPIATYIEEMQKQGDAGDRIEFAIAAATIERDGVVAFARVSYSARAWEQSEPQPWRGSDVFLLMNHENAWRIASLAFGTPDRGQ